VTVKRDATPPETTATLTPTAVGEWYSPRTVTLDATDPVSGVVATEYQLDGSVWTPYTGSFFVESFGPHTLNFRSTDAAGNIEDTKTVSWGTSFDAQAQLSGLSQFLGGMGLNNGLTNDLQNKLANAAKKLDKPKDACNQLNEFIRTVVDQSGKNNGKLTVAQAEQLLSVYQIEVLLGCIPADSPNPQAQVDLLELGAGIDGLGLDAGLANDLGNRARETGKQLAVGNLAGTCSQLNGLSNKVDTEAGKKNPKLTAAQAAWLHASVDAIKTELGC